MATLTVWKFEDSTGAQQSLSILEDLQRQALITVRDAAVVAWPHGARKPRTTELNDGTVAGGLGGAFWGLLFGLIFFVPLLGLMVGAAAGTLAGSLTDVGIDQGFIDQVKQKVTEGTSALFLLSSDAVPDKIQPALANLRPELIQTNLSADQEAQLRHVFGQDEG
jgi:uncharacterized membrane protein